MNKNFDAWNSRKKIINRNNTIVYAHPKEIWWCSLGVNIGAETDGKNEDFERPVIVMKVYNKETMVVLPLSTKQKDDIFHHKIQVGLNIMWAKLTQTRVVSSKRLLRKLYVLNEMQFSKLKIKWFEMF